MAEGNVVALVPRPLNDDENDGPHICGQAECSRCQHRWEAEAPVGSTNLECPNCRTWWGMMVAPVVPTVAWRCLCGGQTFWIVPPGQLQCRACGAEPKGWF